MNIRDWTALSLLTVFIAAIAVPLYAWHWQAGLIWVGLCALVLFVDLIDQK